MERFLDADLRRVRLAMGFSFDRDPSIARATIPVGMRYRERVTCPSAPRRA
jgi:hypothetical protein